MHCEAFARDCPFRRIGRPGPASIAAEIQELMRSKDFRNQYCSTVICAKNNVQLCSDCAVRTHMPCAAMRHSDSTCCAAPTVCCSAPVMLLPMHLSSAMHGLSHRGLSRTYCCSRPISLLLVSWASSRNKRPSLAFSLAKTLTQRCRVRMLQPSIGIAQARGGDDVVTFAPLWSKRERPGMSS